MQIFLFIILGIILLAVIGGWLLKRKIRKMQEQAQQQGGYQQGGYQQGSRQSRRNPDVKIYTTTSATEKSVSNDVGEYVDFEEIKEKK